MKISFAQSLAKLPLPATAKWPEGVWDIETFRQDDFSLELFAPKNHDYQTPHTQDEIYIIIRGRGTFELENEQINFEPGDVLVVPAGKPHCFSQFSDDLAAWVVFWGSHQATTK